MPSSSHFLLQIVVRDYCLCKLAMMMILLEMQLAMTHDEENVMLGVKLKVAKLVFGLLDWAELYSSVIHCSSSINNIYLEDDCDDDCEDGDDGDDDDDDITDIRDVHSNQQWPTQGSCYRTSGMSLTKCRMVRIVAVFMKIHPSLFSLMMKCKTC